MAEVFYIKKDDTAPIIGATLTDAEGTIANLTGATARFIMTPKSSAIGDTPTVDAPCDILDDNGGIVGYQWQTGDTAVAQKYRAEFEVTFIDGRVESFPNSSFIEVRITGDLGGNV